jgi:hypothetical protein
LSKNIELNVLDIYLDKRNPRHDPIGDQAEIIKHLVKNEHIKQLAKDIAKNGLSPIELFAVVKDKSGNFIAVEGNRRLCASILLNDPKLSPDGDLSYFERLITKDAKIPSIVNCIQFDSREDADIWIERRHEGEQGGIGTKQWSADQKTRHNRHLSKPDPNALALSLLEYASASGFIPSKQEDKNKLLTTASRYLGNPLFRETIGVVSARSEADVVINVPHDEFNNVLKLFCNDLIDEASTVNSRTKKADWEEYAGKLIQEGIAPVTRCENFQLVSKNKAQKSDNKTSTQPSNSNISKGGSNDALSMVQNENRSVDAKTVNSAAKTESPIRINKNPDDRKYIISTDFKVFINNKILRRVFEELRTIEVDKQTLAVALLCRAFLENLYSLFYEKVGGYYDKKEKAHLLMEKVIKLIEADSNKSKAETNALGALKRVQANEGNVLSPRTLGANAHAGHYPNARELKREWDNISAILIYMLRRI